MQPDTIIHHHAPKDRAQSLTSSIFWFNDRSLTSDHWVSLLVINSSHAQHFEAFCVHSNHLPITVLEKSAEGGKHTLIPLKKTFNMLNNHSWGIHYHNLTGWMYSQHNMCYCPWRLNLGCAVPRRESNMHLLAFIFNDWINNKFICWREQWAHYSLLSLPLHSSSVQFSSFGWMDGTAFKYI